MTVISIDCSGQWNTGFTTIGGVRDGYGARDLTYGVFPKKEGSQIEIELVNVWTGTLTSLKSKVPTIPSDMNSPILMLKVLPKEILQVEWIAEGTDIDQIREKFYVEKNGAKRLIVLCDPSVNGTTAYSYERVFNQLMIISRNSDEEIYFHSFVLPSVDEFKIGIAFYEGEKRLLLYTLVSKELLKNLFEKEQCFLQVMLYPKQRKVGVNVVEEVGMDWNQLVQRNVDWQPLESYQGQVLDLLPCGEFKPYADVILPNIR